jgi:hypothetical protein
VTGEKLDKHDAEAIEAMLLSPGWSLYLQRLKEEAHRKVRHLIEHEDDTDRTRGFILGLETAMRIPKIIAEEARQTK